MLLSTQGRQAYATCGAMPDCLSSFKSAPLCPFWGVLKALHCANLAVILQKVLAQPMEGTRLHTIALRRLAQRAQHSTARGRQPERMQSLQGSMWSSKRQVDSPAIADLG